MIFVHGRFLHDILCSDAESGIQSVSIALGMTQEDTGVMDWREIAQDGERSVTVTAYVEDGVQTWVKVRAVNRGACIT